MDTVLTLKMEAIVELESYRNAFNDLEYSQESIASLDNILQNFINANFESNELQKALTDAKAKMDIIEKLLQV